MSVKVRIAPSPTGLLHIGNIRAVLFNWLFARAQGGSFALRLDDTDQERSTPAFAEAIERDLKWLGLGWDEFSRQSDRYGRYEDVLNELKASGRAYDCYETPEELSLKRKTQLARGLPPIYDRAALKLTDADREKFARDGRKPHWRFRLDDEDVTWDDVIQGTKTFPAGAVSDPVIVREDGVPLYTFCSVVDDADFGTTHIIRGEDHVTNTAVQIRIWQAVTRVAPPVFAHFPLLVSADGKEMSKRLGTLSVAGLRDEMKIEAMAINALLARLGTSDPITPHVSLDELIDGFDLKKISRATPKFDVEELGMLNAKILHITPYGMIAPRLKVMELEQVDEPFWNAVRTNLTKLDDLKMWWDVVHGAMKPTITDSELAAAALDVLPAEPWDQSTWQTWTEAVKAKTGKSGKQLFMPLRLALTGHEQGPELKNFLPLIGAERARARLAGKQG
ncbi:MAG: glutamate--tRNA ligase [Alphaproteobacteria bacterium]|nr:glutamate--tRNA ligase [Alphaproteobacteria bacterium]